MSDSTATNKESDPLSFEDMAKAVEAIQNARPKQWLLISPDGMLYRGEAISIMSVLAPVAIEHLKDTP